MSPDYKSKVLAAYHQLKAVDALSPNLADPEPAKLKRECSIVLEERFSTKDLEALRLIFGAKDGQKGYDAAIKTTGSGMFKAVNNYLKGSTQDPVDRTVELLAWLIDFEPRPYAVYRKALKEGEIKPAVLSIPGNSAGNEKEHEAPVGQPVDLTPLVIAEDDRKVIVVEQGKQDDLPGVAESTVNGAKKWPIRKTVILSLILILAGPATYLLLTSITKEEGCMYWTGDHYQPVSCNQKIKDTPVYALDSARATQFKKITKPDTITEKSLGAVWYSKIDNEMEYFTSPGFHPVHTERRLKPITGYIINKYVSRK